MSRTFAMGYGLAAYLIFFATLLYLIGFVTGLFVPRTIDDGPATPVALAVLIDVALVALFGVQHAVMARPGFKAWWTRYVPRPIERSTFVIVASAILILLMWQWRPIPAVVWHVGPEWARWAVHAVGFAGWGIVLFSSFLIDHFDLFGLRQVYLHLKDREYRPHPFMERSLYRFVRHPLMVGFLIAFWAAPTMTVGHLVFALAFTAYIVLGVRIEERDLVAGLGEDYREYRRRTPAFIPLPKRAKSDARSAAPA